jgi:hypothetical protein
MQCRRDRGPGLRKRPEPVEDFLLDAHRKSALRDEPSAVSKSVEHAAMQCSTQPRPSTIFKSRRKELFANCARRGQGEPARLGANPLVTLKERLRLVVAVRESPLHLGHLRALTQLAEMGVVVAPLMPGFYARPQTIDELVDHTVGRLLDLVGVAPPEGLVRRWEGARATLTIDEDRE